MFDKKPKTENEILEIAKHLKFDVEQLKKDANSPETYEKLNNDIEYAYSHNIDATPTITVNNQKVVGLKPYEEFVNLVKPYGAR